MTSDDDRVAYLEGEAETALDPIERADLDALRSLLADEAIWATPPDGLEDGVLAAIAGTRGAASTTTPLPPPTVTPATVTPPTVGPPSPTASPGTSTAPVRRRSGASGRRGWMIAIGAAAAALVLAVGTAFLAQRNDDGGADHFDMALTATDLSPGAEGSATLTRTDSGWRIELDATGLPRLDEGRFYEAWLRNEDGVLVSVGTFNEPTNVTLWSGVSPRAFPAFAVTEEQADGDPTSSGRRVLTGQLDIDG